jgi:hypothetical protein
MRNHFCGGFNASDRETVFGEEPSEHTCPGTDIEGASADAAIKCSCKVGAPKRVLVCRDCMARL